MCNLLSVDAKNDPDILAINGASAALILSGVPWEGPIGAVRVGLLDNELVVNPTRKEQQSSKLNLVLAATEGNKVLMIDASADNVIQQDFMKAVKFGVKEAQKVIRQLRELHKISGKPRRLKTEQRKKTVTIVQNIETETVKDNTLEDGVPDQLLEQSETSSPPIQPPSDKVVQERCSSLAFEGLRTIFTDASHDKISRDVAVTELRVATVDTLRREFPDYESMKMSDVFGKLSKEVFRNLIFETNRRYIHKFLHSTSYLIALQLNLYICCRRCDGRGLDDLRYISCQTDVHRPLHGSALFQRGQTQVLCTVTFDSLDSAWKADPASVIIR